MDQNTNYIDHPDFYSEEKRQELLDYVVTEQDYNKKYSTRLKPVSTDGVSSLPVLKDDSLIKAFKTYNLYRKLTTEGIDHIAEVSKWRELLIMHNIGIIHYTLRKIPEREELFSTGYIALHRAVDYFDVSRGNAFITYASRSIITRCLDEIRKEISKRMPTYKEEPASTKFLLECNSFDNNEQVLALLDLYTNPLEKDILLRYFGLNGVNRQASRIIAKHYKISPARVIQIKERGLRKIRLGIANRSYEIECIGQS